MTKTRPSQFALTRPKYRRLVDATIKKLQLAGNVSSPEARMVYAIFVLAVKDWLLGEKQLSRRDRNQAGRWLEGRMCSYYLSHLNINPDYALEKIQRLHRMGKHVSA